MTDWALTSDERAALHTLAADLIRHPSPDPPGDEAAIAGFVADRLRALGFEVETDEFLPRRINVVARLRGTGSQPALVFSAHMDTMPVGEAPWTHPPFSGEILSGRLYGRGAADMKGGLATMVAAAAKIKTSGKALAGDLVLAFSAGESTDCIGARRMVETGALSGAGWLLVSEPTSLGVFTAEAGALWLDAVATGATGHASGSGGVNAIKRLMAFLDRLDGIRLAEAPHPLLGLPSLAVNRLAAGHAPNITPDRARATLDIRTLPGMSAAAVIAELRPLADGIAFEIIGDKPAIETPTDDPFVATALAAHARVTGKAAEPGGVHYFSDSNVLVPALGVPRVIIGPGKAGMSGQTDEWVTLDALDAAAAIYAEIAADLLGGGGRSV